MKRHVPVIVAVALAISLSAWAVAQEDDPRPNIPDGAIVRPDGWFAPRQPQRPAPPLPEKITNVFVIPIKDAIRQSLADAIQRKIAICKGKGAQLVIFDIDTPGGSVAVMEEICEAISEDLADVTTIAYVEEEAMSAGAIISLCCDGIIMRKGTLIGDAMPIMIGPGGALQPLPKAERAKIESYVLAKVRLIANQRGHSPALCEGMISLGIEVWLVRNAETGELRLIDPSTDNWRRNVRQAPGEETEIDPDASWVYVRTVDSQERLVTLTAQEAYDIGLCDLIVSDIKGVLDHFNVTGGPQELTDTWSEDLVAFLTSPTVTGLLMMVGILGLYTEFRTPGVGLPGAVAVVCFAVAFGARYLTGLAGWWEIALIVIGVVLLILEVAVIPGFGEAGVAGIACVLVGLVGVIVPNAPGELPIPKTDLDWSFFRSGLMAMCVGFLLATVAGALLGRYLPKIPGVNRLVLAAAAEYSETTASPHTPLDHISAGDVGVVEGMCRPVGKVRFGEDLLDAVTEGDMIDAGAEVRVLRRAGNRVVVEKTSET